MLTTTADWSKKGTHSNTINLLIDIPIKNKKVIEESPSLNHF